jgi:hypothetical protein
LDPCCRDKKLKRESFLKDFFDGEGVLGMINGEDDESKEKRDNFNIGQTMITNLIIKQVTRTREIQI